MVLTKWKAWIVLIALMIQPMLVGGLLILDGIQHVRMMDAVFKVAAVNNLDIAVKSAKEGTRTPLDMYGATNLAQLESRLGEAKTHSNKSMDDVESTAQVTHYARISVVILESLLAATGVFLIGGLFRRNGNNDEPTQVAGV